MKKEITELWQYGMKERGYSLGCQPAGVYHWQDVDKKTTGYWSVITYTRELTPEEISKYSLEFITKIGGDIIQ